MARPLSPQEVHRRQRTKSGLLTAEEVARIKTLYASGVESPRSLARAYDVSLWTIRAIIRGDTWAWVEADDYGKPRPEMPAMSPELAAEAAASEARFRQRMGLPEVPKEVAPDTSVVDRLLSEAQAVKDKEQHTDDMLAELGDSSDKQETPPESEAQGQGPAPSTGPEGSSADDAPTLGSPNRYF